MLPAIHVEQPMSSATPALRDASPIRQRLQARGALLGDTVHFPNSRRSSNISDSSQRSSARNLFTPSSLPRESKSNGEVTHWHSVPLVVAVVPALAGLIFHNGGTIITDLTLLALAAYALNWALRIPWEWYHSAQAEVEDLDAPLEASYRSDTIIEESESEEHRGEDATKGEANDTHNPPARQHTHEHPAAASLRQRQTSALLACFIMPLIMTWLLHYIRASLSRPAEGLISNTNLTIFLFAAEFRPCHEVGRMFQARTLYLQRILAASSHQTTDSGLTPGPDEFSSLISRMSEVEEHVVAHQTNSAASKKSEVDMIAAVRKSVQSELDSLNRAMRRYEKRATVQAMDTDSRLQGLEARMSDAITLAAAAERNVLHARDSTQFLSTVFHLISWPITLASSLIAIPLQLVSMPYVAITSYLRPTIDREKRTAGFSKRRESRTRGDDERKRIIGRGGKKAA